MKRSRLPRGSRAVRGPLREARISALSAVARVTLAGIGLSSVAVLVGLVATNAGLSAQEPDSIAEPASPETDAGERLFDWTSLQFTPEEYARRRDAVLAELQASGGGGLLVLSALGLSHGDTFRQADDFLYLTGLELPGSALFLNTESGSAALFAPLRDFRFESATRPNDFPGRPLADDPELAQRSGIERVLEIGDLDRLLVAWADGGRTLRFNPGRAGEIRRVETSLIADWDPQLLSLYYLQQKYPELRIENAYSEIARVRMIKSPAEIDAMRRSANLTMESIRAAAGTIRDGVTERELEGAFEAACKSGGAQRPAFASIVKSGPNSLWPWRILAAHYRPSESGDAGGRAGHLRRGV